MSGKTALITGSNRGIGKAILMSLAKNGANVIMHCRKPTEESEKVLYEASQLGVNCYAAYADLSDPNGTHDLVEQINLLGQHVDILVLNASVQFRSSFTDVSDEEYDLQMNTNFRAPFKLVQHYIPKMLEKRWGRVITIGSVQQTKPNPDLMVYSASKMALLNMVISLAGQVAPFGITVNNIAPGAILTDRNRDVLSIPQYEKKVLDSIPMNYIGDPYDIAGLAVYLASPESQYMTGQNIYIDGGKGL